MSAPTLTPAAFAQKWRGTTTTEKGAAAKLANGLVVKRAERPVTAKLTLVQAILESARG